MKRTGTALVALALSAALAAPVLGAGNLASEATRLDPTVLNGRDLTLSVSEYTIETGKYYRWQIESDGFEEFQVKAPELFRASWINQVVINDLEVKPLGLDSVEFDAEGVIDIWFVPIQPGRYEFWVEGFEDRGMRGVFNVE